MTTATAMDDRTSTRPAPRTLRSDLEVLRSRVIAVIEEQPIAATAAAAGLGFVVGSRLARPAMALLMTTAARAAATWIGETIRQTALAQLAERRAATDPNTGGPRS
jgi:ABC-type proline/glycine betaine transport system permease subunit